MDSVERIADVLERSWRAHAGKRPEDWSLGVPWRVWQTQRLGYPPECRPLAVADASGLSAPANTDLPSPGAAHRACVYVLTLRALTDRAATLAGAPGAHRHKLARQIREYRYRANEAEQLLPALTADWYEPMKAELAISEGKPQGRYRTTPVNLVT